MYRTKEVLSSVAKMTCSSSMTDPLLNDAMMMIEFGTENASVKNGAVLREQTDKESGARTQRIVRYIVSHTTDIFV
jgi:hypothetical protein